MRVARSDIAVSAPALPAAAPRFRTRSDQARVLLEASIGLACVVLAVTGGAALVDSRARAFFAVGQGFERLLRDAARAARQSDAAAFAASFADSYSGTQLGLTQIAASGTRGGVTHFRLRAGSARTSRTEALREWSAYFAQFEAIDEVRFEVDRIERWQAAGPAVATARFELIGRLRGAARSSIDRARLLVRVDGPAGRPRIAAAALLDGERLTSEAPMFEDVAPAAGVAFRHRYYPPFLDQPMKFGTIRHGPGGITAVDYDHDGWYDLFIPDGVESRLLRNRGDGTFEDVTTRVGLAGLDGVSVAVFADYDNDGLKDAFVSRTFRANQLFHNRGDGTFEDVTAAAGIGEDCCTTAASWADYDNDGFLDLYVGRYLDPRLRPPTTFFYARNGEPNQLYRNNGDGTFTNVTVRAGVGESGLCLGTAWGDYDDDGFLDLYVVNDFGRSTLYHNNRDGTFTDVTVESNTLAYGAGMNASVADYDNDGRLDLYTTDIRSDSAWLAEPPLVFRYMLTSVRQGVWTTDMSLYVEMFRQSGLGVTGVFRKMASGNTLLRNNGDGTFEDVTLKARANPPGWFWGAAFADFDNDTWQDIYAADGWIYNDRDSEIELEFLWDVMSRQADYKTGALFDVSRFGGASWHGWERNRYLRNNGDGTFTEIGHATGSDLLLNSRGVAVADFWNRGRLDIAVAASNDRHALLKNTAAAAGHWLGIELVGTRTNRDAVGAHIAVRAGGARQIRQVVLGDGYGSQSSLRQYFGLGTSGTVDELVVRWPRSGVQTFRGLAADRIVEIVEGRHAVVEKHYRAPREWLP
ncbi:MAG: CRTAC1 family protein [Acidobacteria bacterium]|nr:CRTAC1 family protein [Acidobacteriota bacterium]